VLDRRTVLRAQGLYYAATGALPFVSRRSFEAMTGPKAEWWLVETVGALVTVVGAGLLGATRSQRVTPEVTAIAAGCAASFVALDVAYVRQRRISPSYLGDAAIQAALLAALAASR
jgi:hypothetical protein